MWSKKLRWIFYSGELNGFLGKLVQTGQQQKITIRYKNWFRPLTSILNSMVPLYLVFACCQFKYSWTRACVSVSFNGYQWLSNLYFMHIYCRIATLEKKTELVISLRTAAKHGNTEYCMNIQACISEGWPRNETLIYCLNYQLHEGKCVWFLVAHIRVYV